MEYLQKIKNEALILLAALATLSVTACGNDEDQEDTIYHKNYVEGKLNNHDIMINEVNENIQMDKSIYDFSSGNQTDVPAWFDWEVNLIETKDSIITLHLHIDDVTRTNAVIYSPNADDPIKTKSTCYATVKDLKTNKTSIYHPIHTAPITVMWKTFMMMLDNDLKNLTKQYNYYRVDFVGNRWPGIEGSLQGTLTSDEASELALKINIKFILY